MNVLAKSNVAARMACASSGSVNRVRFTCGIPVHHAYASNSPASQRVSVRPMAIFGGGASKQAPSTLYEIEVKTIDGQAKSMADFKGKVLLIVNVASQCGFTPQYKELAELYNKYVLLHDCLISLLQSVQVSSFHPSLNFFIIICDYSQVPEAGSRGYCTALQPVWWPGTREQLRGQGFCRSTRCFLPIAHEG